MRKQQIERWAAAHTFTSERLVYRPVRPADVAAVLANHDDEVRRRQGWAEVPYDRRGYERQLRRPVITACAPHLLVCTRDGAVVGDYSVQAGRGPGEVGLGWSFGPSGRGRGFGAESLPVVLGYLHRHVGVPRIAMGTALDNHRARRQITRAGAVPDADGERAHTLPNGVVIDSCWFVHDDQEVAAHVARGGWVPPCHR